MSESHVDIIRSYFDAIEAGVTPEALADFFTPDVIQEESPNRLLPHGARRDLKEILEAFKRGKEIMKSQRFEIVHTISDGDEIALEVRWTGHPSASMGSLPAGTLLRAKLAVFIRLVRGKIARQRNYDCFEAF